MPEVSVVLCMDTEGPCADPANPELLDSWEGVDTAMDRLFEPSFRNRVPDSAGGGLRVGWFFLTWTGFLTNPRARAFGYHAVRDHYLARWGDALAAFGDEQCWHYHQPPTSGVGNEWSTEWSSSDEYARIVSRQLLERDWFPVCFRAGGTIVSPESSRWVDSWFPVDYSNRAPLELPGLVDWSTGVADWSLYHPDTEDFRRPGAGRRLMARCLDLATNVHAVSEADVAAAFERARAGAPAILAVFDHDYRDIRERLEDFTELVGAVAARHPDVTWRWAGPLGAVRDYVRAPAQRPVDVDAFVHGDSVTVWSTEAPFQAIPWIAVRTPDGEVAHVREGVVREDASRWRWTPALEWEEAAFGVSTTLGEAAVVRIAPSDGPGAAFLRRPLRSHPLQPRSIWSHSKLHPRLLLERASGEAPELDSVGQALEWLRPRLEPGMSVLDVGSAGGYLARSLAGSDVRYHGIDPSRRAIELGRALLPDADLRAIGIEELPADERHDAVVCLSTLYLFPDFRQPLEAMARAAERWLVVRSSFGDRTEVRYLPDAWLEPGFQSMRMYLSIFSRAEVQSFLEAEGFRVTWTEDRRQRERFGGAPEVVGGIEIPYEFLFAERIRERPSEEDVLGPLAEVARRWREEGR